MSQPQAPCFEIPLSKLPEHLQRWQRADIALPDGTIYVPFEEVVWLWIILGAPLALLFIVAGAMIGLSIIEDMTQSLPWLGLAFSLGLAGCGVWILYKLMRAWRRQHEQRSGIKRYGVIIGEQEVVIFDERVTWFLLEQLDRARLVRIRAEKSSYLELQLDISLDETRYVRHTLFYAKLSTHTKHLLERALKVEVES